MASTYDEKGRQEQDPVDHGFERSDTNAPQRINYNATFDWTGPNDPDNPRNFSLTLRVFSTIAVTLLAFVSTFAASIYAPAQEEVAAHFHCSEEVAVLPLSLYNLGLAFGPLVGAPLSETYGRKVVFLVTTPMFAVFTLGAGFSQSVASLIVCRFFAGVFAAPAVSNASATITDYTAGRYRAISLGFYYSVPFFGAVLAPLVGGFVVLGKGWRWTQWTTLFFIIAFYAPVCFTKETYKKRILQRRAIRHGLEDAASRRSDPARAAKHFATVLILRPVHMLCTEPIVTLVCMYNGFIFGLMYTFVVAVPWIFRHYYGFGKTAESLSFLGLIVGTLIAPIPLVLIDLNVYQRRLKEWRQTHLEDDHLPPENRLVPAMTMSFALPVALFVVAWTAHFRVHWMVPIVFQGVALLSSLLVYASANLYMLDTYGPLYGASAAGAAMLSRYALSAAFPLFSLQMYRALGVGWATSLLAFCTLALAPIPWLFWKYGAVLRKKSRYETSS